jgi:hypothetical protein
MKRYLNWTIYIGLIMLGLGSKIIVETTMRKPASMFPSISPIAATYQAKSLRRYSLGFQNLLSGMMWVRLLQKADTRPIKRGDVSWEFAQLDAITSLDIDFIQAYAYGSIALSVFRQDKIGARILLEKWVHRRPTYWRARYLLGYHLYYEMGDFRQGAKQLLIAASLPGAPPYLNALGIRLMSETGAIAQAMKLSLEIFPLVKDPEGIDRLTQRIRNLNFALQKAAWNRALTAYRARTHQEPDSLDDLRPYLFAEMRTVSSIVDNTPESLRPMLKEVYQFRYSPQTRKIESTQRQLDLELDKLGVFVPHSPAEISTKPNKTEKTGPQ